MNASQGPLESINKINFLIIVINAYAVSNKAFTIIPNTHIKIEISVS